MSSLWSSHGVYKRQWAVIFACKVLLFLLAVFVAWMLFASITGQHERVSDWIALSGGSYCQNVKKHIAIDMRKGMWQAQRVVPSEDIDDVIFGMHAYYDDREVTWGGDSKIRLFLTMRKESNQVLNQEAYCYLWIEKLDHPYIVKAYYRTIDIAMYEPAVFGKTYHSGFLSCSVPRTVTDPITHVSFHHKYCEETTVYIPVSYLERQDNGYAHTFGQCTANGISFGYYDDDDAKWMVEWIEANRLFGITQFNIPNGTMQASPKFQQVLDYYQNEGLLNLYHQIPPVVKYENSRNSSQIAVRTGYNECLYRNMFRYEYIVSIDLDELIVPRKEFRDYHDIVRVQREQLGKKSYGSVTYPSNAYFWSILGKDQAVSSRYNLVSSKYVKNVFDHRNKSFTNPRDCMVGFAHYCLIRLVELRGERGLHGTEFGQKFAKTHHYRKQCLKTGETRSKDCQAMQKVQKENRDMERFAPALWERVKVINKKLKL